MLELLEKFDFSYGRNGDALELIMHHDSFESYRFSGHGMSSFEYLAEAFVRLSMIAGYAGLTRTFLHPTSPLSDTTLND